jgi:hypothetical protein
MKATKTLKVIVISCVLIICMHGYATAEKKGPIVNLDDGAEYISDAQDAQDAAQVKPDVDINTSGNGIGKVSIGAIIFAYIVSPWGTLPTFLTATTGLGIIYNALVPERNDKPEINTFVDLATKDQDRPQ